MPQGIHPNILQREINSVYIRSKYLRIFDFSYSKPHPLVKILTRSLHESSITILLNSINERSIQCDYFYNKNLFFFIIFFLYITIVSRLPTSPQLIPRDIVT